MTTLRPRPYQGLADLPALHAVLTAGRQAEQAGQRGSYYIHAGDLNWWLFYLNQDADLARDLTVWENGSGSAGWSLLSPSYRAFDVFLLPDLHGTPEAAAAWAWTEARLAELYGPGPLRTMWVAYDDEMLIEHLRQRGFNHDPDYSLLSLERPLAAALPAAAPPPGFTLRPVAGESEAAPRALAAHAAFESTLPTDAYVERYRRFMRSPVYPGALDLVAVPHAAPDQAQPTIAAFAIAWTDPVNRLALFEPVGTHPQYQRQGLARAVLLDALARLRAAGLSRARVCVESDNSAALRLYQSLGFEPNRELVAYYRSQ